MTKSKNHKKINKDQKIAKALVYEVKFGGLSEVQKILQTEPNINNIRGSFDCPIFITAVKTENKELVALFLNYAKNHPDKANINIKDDYGSNAIIIASISAVRPAEVAQMLQILIDGGVDPTITTSDGYTALHAVVQRKNLLAAELLLKNGVNPNAVYKKDIAEDMQNIAPIHYAALERDLDMIELLISYGADLTLETSFLNAEEPCTARGLANRSVMLASDNTLPESVAINSKKHAREENDNQSDNNSEPKSKETKHSHNADNNGANYHSDSVINEDKDSNDNLKQASNTQESKTHIDQSLADTILKNMYSWIHELPEWLQKQILSSSAVRAVIESIEQNTKIYDKKVDLDIYQQDIFSEADFFSYIDDTIDQKVTVSEVLSSELVDTNMVFDGNYVNGLILPTSGEQAINFNGLNFDDLAVFW